MEHTYLRYECADSFGLATTSGSSRAPLSNSILAFLGSSRNAPLLTTAGSNIMGFNLKSCLPALKLGHREQLTGGVGTGRALNSDEVVCLDIIVNEESSAKVASGWVDGSVRVFDVHSNEKQAGLVHSLLQENEDEKFVQREPLVLNGHNQSPVRSITFDKANPSRLASGGSDGSVVLWDIVAETGLFRLLGHRGGITDIIYLHLPGFDGLVTSSLDGLVKIWDLQEQCCTQTLASHRGEVWSAACLQLPSEDDDDRRWRLITGASDGQVRVWMVQSPRRSMDEDVEMIDAENSEDRLAANVASKDSVCTFMGMVIPPPNVSTSADRVACIHFHPSGKYVATAHANSKNVDIYLIRSTKESLKKKQRRMRRREEKIKRKANVEEVTVGKSGQKRGILDDPVSSDDENDTGKIAGELVDPEAVKASDEFEYIATVRSSHKVRGFSFVPNREKGELTRIVCALSTNSLETHLVSRKKASDGKTSVVSAEKVATVDMYGHPTGIRSIALSSDDNLACTVSKNVAKVWNVGSRSVIQSLAPSVPFSKKSACYGLCAMFLPGNTHIILGTREGYILLVDISAGEVVHAEENAHDGAIWSIDLRRPSTSDPTISIVTGSADKCVKFWDIIEADGDDADIYDSRRAVDSGPVIVHTRTLQMSDDVVAVRYSNSMDTTKRMVFVSTLDCTIKVFFEDSLKLFLSLYGHKLPALAVDASDDDILLASSGADKTIKIWGLDYGDTHRTLHGHEDSVTDLRFVRRTHNFFTTSKDGTVRYWDADRFEQILLLNGHCAEVNCLAISRTGAFVLTAGMDRQVRVWERTKDIVFLEEERERELEQAFERVDNRDEGGTARILDLKGGDEEDGDDTALREKDPQSESAVKRSVMSVSSGDRIMDAVERADSELKEIAMFRKTHGPQKTRPPSPMLLNMEPAQYVLWVLRTVKNAELEQSLVLLPLRHVERLLYYIVVLLKGGRGVELCSRVGICLVKMHQNQIITDRSLVAPLRELRRLIQLRLGELRDLAGYDKTALKIVGRLANDRKLHFIQSEKPKDVWAGLGFGSDVAAALEGRPKKV